MSTRQTIEFIVVPQENLYLEGTKRNFLRVNKGAAYPCQMQKNQTFSCLFRHYAKHNGLRKEDLEFYFVDELLPDQMPESVHLMPQDEIWVQHKRSVETQSDDETPSSNLYTQSFRSLLTDDGLSDVSLLIGERKEPVPAHKCILSARSDYFKAMFRKGGMSESLTDTVQLFHIEKRTFARVLEFIYTNSITDLNSLPWIELSSLLMAGNEFMLEDLKLICSESLSSLIDLENISSLMTLSIDYSLPSLRDASTRFLRTHYKELRSNKTFCTAIENSPEIGLLLLEALQDPGPSTRSASFLGNTSSSINNKRARSSRSQSSTPSHNPVTMDDRLESNANDISHEFIPLLHPSLSGEEENNSIV